MAKRRCSQCGSEMNQMDVYPTRPGHDIHVFKCSKCGELERVDYDIRFGPSDEDLIN